MYYVLYLASLCRRRHWPEPLYESYASTGGTTTTTNSSSTNSPGAGAGAGTARPGYTCIVRVNNREYQTDAVCASETLARENAAMRAYLICRNFSVNDGKYPAGHDHGGVVQGIPVAIGKGRRSSSRYADETGLGPGDSLSEGSYGSRSGGSSPESYESEMLGIEMRRAIAAGGQVHAHAHAHSHSHSHARAMAFARGA